MSRAPQGLTRTAVFAAALTTVVGCGKSDSPEQKAAPAHSAREVAADELAPGELAEGSLVAFGLPLPARMPIEKVSKTFVLAHGSVDFEAVANYVRKRVEAASVVTGPTKTTFEDARVIKPRGAPLDRKESEDGATVLRVEVATTDGMTTIACQRVYKPKLKPGLSEEERWNKHGLTKDGKPVDPKKFE